VKSAIVCTAIMVSLAASAFATDERPLPASAAMTANAKAPSAENHEQPPASASPMPAPAVSANVRTPALTALPAAPSAITPVKPLRAEGHRFLDVTNSFALSAVATSLAADAVSTQKGLSYPGFYEVNPVARPFVQSRGGTAVYSAGSLGLVAAAMYVAHRTHHHKLERIFPFAIAGWEGLVTARNYHVIATRAK
jgi:hypothetical protein